MSIIDEIKQKIDIVELVGQYVQLQKSGRNFRAICPFHSEKTPSFFVFQEQQSWHCFGACGTGGDIYSFIMKKEGLDFGQTLRLMAEKAGVTLVSPELENKDNDRKKERLIQINEATASYYHYLLTKTTEGEEASNYLTQRKISPKIIENFQLGFSKDSFEDLKQHLLNAGSDETELLAAGLILEKERGDSYDRFRNRLMFPIRDINGKVIGFGARALDDSLPKYLNSPQTIVFDKSSNLYAIDRAKDSIRKKGEVVIMEGYMDVLTSHQHGWDNAVASMGTALTEKQLSSLKKLTKNLVLALDADTAGEEATLRMAENIDIENYLHAEVKVVIPHNSKDPDEEIRKDPALWAQSLEKATSIMDFILEATKGKVDFGNIQGKIIATDRLLPVISKIDDPIRRGHYVQKLAQMLKIKENDLRDRLTKLKFDERKRKTRGQGSPKISKSVSLSFNPIEDYCLGMLLQYPALRTEGMKLDADFFEFSETKELFLKWQQNVDMNSLKDVLDSTLHPYLDSLLNKVDLPTIMENENKQKKIFFDCINRLQEKFFKNMEVKKAEMLTMGAESGGKDLELVTLKERGIEGSKQLKRIFTEQHRQRRSSVI
jgi:DNA primase